MRPVFGRVIKYVLRVILVFILSLLLVGLIRYRGDVGAYVNSLNTRDRRQARGELSISKPSSFAHMFRGTGQEQGSGTETLSGDLNTGEMMTGLDAYDPSRENDLDAMESSTATGFGFKDEEENELPIDPKTTEEEQKLQLLNLIKQRELNK